MNKHCLTSISVSGNSGSGNRARARQGFTLIELLIVIAIIVLLASSIIGLLINGKLRAENERVRAAMVILQSGLDRYKEDFGQFPKIDDSLPEPRRNNLLLQELMKEETFTTRDGLKMRRGPALEDTKAFNEFLGDSDGDFDTSQPAIDTEGVLVEGVEILDPWGQPFIYRFPGADHSQIMPGSANNKSSYDLYSVGRDGIATPEASTQDETDDWTNWFEREQVSK